MKRNRLFAALMTLGLSLSLASPALAAETADARLAKVTLAVKATLDVDDSYTQFYGEPSETALGPTWSLRWSDDARTLTVNATEEGKVLSLSYWDQEPSYHSASYGPKFPPMTAEEAKNHAQAFLDKVLTAGETAAFSGGERDSLSATSYTFSGAIRLNGTSSPLTFRVRVRLSDGMVTSFSRGDVSQYVGELPTPDTVTTAEKAGELLAGPFEMYVEYVWDSEREMAVLRYLPKARDDYYVDAATGELVNLTQLRALLNRGSKGDNMTVVPEASRNELTADSAAGVQLTEQELAGVAKLEGIMTQEALESLVKGYTALGLKDFELVGATFTVQKDQVLPILPIHGAREEKAAEAEDQVTARLTFARNTEAGIARRYVTLDAKTGELFSMWGHNPYLDKEPTVSQEKAQETALSFLKTLWPDQLAKTEVYDSTEAGHASDSISFTLCQKENGYFYPANRLNVSVDAATGAVMAFSRSFDDAVTFESPEGMIPLEKALAIWAGSFPVEFGYQVVPVALDLLGPEVMPLRNDGYTYYNALKPGYVYGERDGWYSGVNALDGTLTGSPYTVEEAMAYDDIAGHWAEDILNRLALYEVGWQGGKALPEQTLTQADYLILLASADGYHYTAGELDSLYEYAARRGLLAPEERDENKAVTRGEMVKLLLDSLGYKEFAGFQGIFRCDFTDAAEIPEPLMGYAALSQALGLVDGGDAGTFGANAPATRAQAAALLWKYMSK